MSMYRVARRVKPTRRTDRPETPFGAGVLRSLPEYRADHTWEDELWAAQAFADREGPTDAELDAWARERAWEDAYTAGFVANARCWLCGLPSGIEDEGGVCSLCGQAEERGECRDCGRADDFIGVDRRCPPCSLEYDRAAGMI